MTHNVNAIVAVCDDWGIGYKDKLLVRNKADMASFVEHTMGATVIMGRNTLESFPGGRALKGRRNIVLTRDDDFERADVEVAHGVRDAIELACNDADVWIIGGESVYRSFLPYCEHVIVTRNHCVCKADAFFPDLDHLTGWHLASTEPGGTTADGVEYDFATYENFLVRR